MEIRLFALIFITVTQTVVCADSNELSQDEGNTRDVPRLPMPEAWTGNGDGSSLMGPRIIGGSPVPLGEFRGIVSIQTSRSNNHFCGGTLITVNNVLTAAHCVVDKNGVVAQPSSITVMADDLSINQFKISPNRQVRQIDLVFAHPRYSLKTLRHDIAVLRVNHPFQVTQTFGPVALSGWVPLENFTCQTAGWGATVEDGKASSRLLGVNLTVVPKNLCNAKQSYDGMIKQNMFCAGSMDGGKDSCQGDSGGGLICNTSLSGVVSFGFGCGRKDFPGVYTDVSKYIRWINSTVLWSSGQTPPAPTTVKPISSSYKLRASSLTYFLTFLILFSCQTVHIF